MGADPRQAEHVVVSPDTAQLLQAAELGAGQGLPGPETPHLPQNFARSSQD